MAEDNENVIDPGDLDDLLKGQQEPPAGITPGVENAPSKGDTDGNQAAQDATTEPTASTTSESSAISSATSNETTDSGALNADELGTLLNQPTGDATSSNQSPEELLSQAELDLARAVSPDLEDATPSDAKPFAFQDFDASSQEDGEERQLQSLHDVELDLCIELGRTELLIDEVLKLRPGSVVPLDKLAGDPVDVLVNGRLVARGEVLVLNDNFCVRVAEILSPDF